MARLYVLYEHATSYAIFKVKHFEELGVFIPNLESAVNDRSRFQSMVQIVGFSKFKTSVVALENMCAISEGILTEQLQIFLNTTISRKKNSQLGVVDSKLAAAITEALNISCSCVSPVPELIRGIRTHFPHYLQSKYNSFTAISAEITQLGLGHAYSRAKIKFNVHRIDNMIIQSIGLLDQLDKDVNLFSMRIREWYSYHYPELVQLVPDIVQYARLVKIIQDKKTLSEEKREEMEKAGVDSGRADTIIVAARSSMGMDISPVDMLNIVRFANRVISLAEYRTQLAQYLHNKVTIIAPNLAILVGELITARLISRAGSLTNLAKMPASTVQILGAEKALFRSLKTHSATPKYGILYNSSYIARAGSHKGRISRFLATKCSIAARIDCFADHINTSVGPIVSNVYGKKLREQIESRLHFYETGELPRKTSAFMQEAKELLQKEQLERQQNQHNIDEPKNKLNKMKRKHNCDEDKATNDEIEDLLVDKHISSQLKKKIKKVKNKKENACVS